MTLPELPELSVIAGRMQHGGAHCIFCGVWAVGMQSRFGARLGMLLILGYCADHRPDVVKLADRIMDTVDGKTQTRERLDLNNIDGH